MLYPQSPSGSSFPQNKERKDESWETSFCDLYNLPGKLNLAVHIWSHFMDSFPCKKDWGLRFLDASVAVWNQNSRSFTTLCFQIKIWIWKDKHVSKKKMKRDSFLEYSHEWSCSLLFDLLLGKDFCSEILEFAGCCSNDSFSWMNPVHDPEFYGLFVHVVWLWCFFYLNHTGRGGQPQAHSQFNSICSLSLGPR